MDGNIFSGNQVIAGGYPVKANKENFQVRDFCFTQIDENTALVDYGSLRFTLMENGMKIIADEDFVLENRIGKTDRHFPDLVFCDDSTLRLGYNGMEYGIELTVGNFEGPSRVSSEDGIIELRFI